MRSLALILISVLFASTSMAGKQESAPVDNPSVKFENNRLVVSGTVRSKKVSASVQFFKIKGIVNGEDCNKTATPCQLKVSVSGNKLTATVNIDRANDGNPQTILRDAPVATIASNGDVQFVVPFAVSYIVERYSFIERALGQKDTQGIELTLKM